MRTKHKTIALIFICTQDRIRTCTPFRALPPQSSMSTNFTTWADGIYYKSKIGNYTEKKHKLVSLFCYHILVNG